MEQKINNTFLKAHEQIDSLQNAFRPGGKLEKAIIEPILRYPGPVLSIIIDRTLGLI